MDARHLADGRGVARYTDSLLEALTREFPDDSWRLLVPGRGELEPLRRLRGRPNVMIRRHALGGRLLFGAAALTRRPRADRLLGPDLDVFWVPAPAPLALSGRVPFVLTVHDLSFELRPSDFTPYERLWHTLARPRALALEAGLVIVPAQATREELIGRWALPPERVRVIPEGVERPSEPAEPGGVLERFGLAAGRYFLAVGALEPRKAPLLLRDAFAHAREQRLHADLVFAGEGRLASRLRAPGIHLTGRVSDAELQALYAGALALVVPSLLEGFGLPLREALAHGVPAVVSDLPVFGAELSEAVLRFPVGDKHALADALLLVERDLAKRRAMAMAAPGCVAGLSWEEAARRTREALAQAARGALVPSPARGPARAPAQGR